LTLACGFKAQSATASVNGNAVRATLEAGKGTATLRFSKDVRLKKGGKVAVAVV